MRFRTILGHRLRSLFRRAGADAELQRELDLHLQQLTKAHIAAGMAEPDARTAARREFGSLEWTKEQCRDMRRVSFVDDLLKDLAYAARLLRKSPGFTLTAVCRPRHRREHRDLQHRECVSPSTASVRPSGTPRRAIRTKRRRRRAADVRGGATSADVNRLVVMQGLKPALAGIALGFVGAVFACQVLRSLLFGITPVDPLTFAVVPPALLTVAALACYLPATRAAHLSPTVALRAD